jgi:flavodoxin
MNQKLIIVIVVLAVLGVGVYFLLNTNGKTKENENTPTNRPVVNEPTDKDNDKQEDENDKDNPTSPSKMLVVYFSASGSTKRVAEEISKNLNADLFELVPENVYTADDLDWTDTNSRVSKEHNDISLRNVKLKNTEVENWESYDTVLIGYPIWWGIAAWPVDTFVKANDFNGKTVIPFCTSASSGLGQSGDLLKQEAKGGNWKEGHRFSSGASSSDIKAWTDGLQ